MKKRVYFGHPINVYDTELEKFLMERIARFLPGWEIENPNQPHHADGYKRYSASGGRGMDYYFKEVLPGCSAGIFLPFRDDTWGMGVYGEAEFIAGRNLPIWQIDCNGLISEVRLKSVRVLTVAETRERIRTPDGKPMPY